MRIAIIGVGAVGCLIAARMAQTEHQVTLIARRAAVVTALRSEGLEMTSPEGVVTRHPMAVTDDPLSIGQQDLVILCVKAYSLAGTLGTLSQLIGPHTAIVPMINGIPWWYPRGQPAPLAGCQLKSLDADGSLAAAIPIDRVVGALTYVAVESLGVGRIHHINGSEFRFGLPVHRRTTAGAHKPPAPDAITAVFHSAGFDAVTVPDIRSHIWTKLWGNLALNPLSVLTGADQATLCTDPGSRRVVLRMMQEAQTVAERLGVTFAMSLDARIAAAAAIGNFKTSMLQDYLASRPLELDAILGAVIELAERTTVGVPTLRMIHGLTALRSRARND